MDETAKRIITDYEKRQAQRQQSTAQRLAVQLAQRHTNSGNTQQLLDKYRR
ncbi:MAG: hypothetical protein IJ716_09365 [Lachnospiraceae bacterium]|nr:hypothetical protein [Lachnospiraceae bacterium]